MSETGPIRRGSPDISKNELKHPKTGVTVDEAIEKAIIMDTRSPQLSPIARVLPKEKYEDIITTPYTTNITSKKKSYKGPGLTPRKDPYYSHRSSRHSSVRSYCTEDTDTPIEIVVEDNGDGTYTPVKLEEIVTIASKFDGLPPDELFQIRFNMEAEVNRLVKSNPHLAEIGILPIEPGDMDMDELKGYLGHINDQIGNHQQWEWFDKVLEAVYNGVALVMEKMGVPMKAYFDKLKSRIVDYRMLLMKDPSAKTTVEKIMPILTSSSNKSIGLIVIIMVAQVVIGCVAAFIGSYSGNSVAPVANGGAMLASNQLDNYMFGNGTLWDIIKGVGSSIFGDKAKPPPKNVVADV